MRKLGLIVVILAIAWMNLLNALYIAENAKNRVLEKELTDLKASIAELIPTDKVNKPVVVGDLEIKFTDEGAESTLKLQDNVEGTTHRNSDGSISFDIKIPKPELTKMNEP